MPGYNDPVRLLAKEQRGQKLVESAQRFVSTRWTGKSWTEVGYSVLGSTRSAVTWVSGQGLKMGINYISGGVFGVVGEQLVSLSSNLGYGPEHLGSAIAQSTIEQVWPLIEDQIKGKAEELARSEVETRAEGRYCASTQIASDTAARARTAFETKAPNEVVARIQDSTVSLVLRLAALKKAAQQPNVAYCDNVYYMALEMYQVDALRAEVLADCEKVIDWLQVIKDMAAEVRVDEIKASIVRVAESVVASASVPHYNSYALNVWSRSGQCSAEHCFGPHTTQL